MIHDLKCWPEPFKAVLSGAKRHEIRIADRPYKVGDILHLREWVPPDQEEAVYNAGGGWNKDKYTGRTVDVEITYITNGGAWSLPDNLCVMSIRHVRWRPTPEYSTGDDERFVIGQRVRTTYDNGSKDWTKWSRDYVRWGVEGHIDRVSDSHGLVYEVRHTDGTCCWYEHKELEARP